MSARIDEVVVAMIPDLDIYRSANVLVTRHGQDALIQAAMNADAMLEKGDLKGCTRVLQQKKVL